ncbi:MAG TPA: zf-HC2 domain-containing protein [Blastocatellia bacterium]|jgi:hypothetical protein|nr:zf-HC2 domain-containing protein [Blastocatellia bacterium]
MKTDDLENELRNLKFAHLTESEMVAYCDQELDQIGRARLEAHLKQCFTCERRLELIREEGAAISNRRATADEIGFVERLMEQVGAAQRPSPAKGVTVQERLAEYLRQMIASWQIAFKPVRRDAARGEEVWRWQSEDGKLQARATIEQNADLIIHFSSSDIELEGVRLNVRIGQLRQDITLRRVSESGPQATVTVPWQYRKGTVADISIEII